MYLVIKQQIKLAKKEYLIFRDLCHISKNLFNQALYEIRQEYFNTKKYLNYYDVIKKLQGTENYSLLQAQISQQTLKVVDESFKSFFALIKKGYKARIPKYLDKEGFFELIIPTVNIKDGKFQLPYSRKYGKEHDKIYISVPPILEDKQVKQIKIIPKHNAGYFEIQYIYLVKEVKVKENITNVLAIDFGINNLCTCVTNIGKSFILDGKKLKSYNQWYNKRISILNSIKDKQKIKGYTDQLYIVTQKRNNRINYFTHKTCKYIIDYCVKYNIDTIVCGVNKDFQRNTNMGKKNNQVFTHIPFGRIRENLRYRCSLVGIRFVEQEESYTSKASFWDKDIIPVYGDENIPTFLGKRIKRGLYRTKDGKLLNADVNGALNIMRKSNVVSLDTLYSRGELDTPTRIRVA